MKKLQPTNYNQWMGSSGGPSGEKRAMQVAMCPKRGVMVVACWLYLAGFSLSLVLFDACSFVACGLLVAASWL